MRNTPQSNQNPQKQQPLNIVGYLSGKKLYKQQINVSNLTPKSNKSKNRQSPLSNKFNSKKNEQEKISQSAISPRHTFTSQKYQNKDKNNFQGFYTSRNEEKQSDLKIKFKLEDEYVSQNTNKIKNFVPRNRFYYKSEYDSPPKIGESTSPEYIQKQHDKVLTNYIKRINIQQTKRQPSPLSYSHVVTNTTRSKSPLQQSHEQLFIKCYRQTYQHLRLMKKQINQSQQNIHLIHKDISQVIFETIKQRSYALRQQLIDLVEQLVSQWQRQQWQFVKSNQILFMDDILQLQEQLNKRQYQVNELMQRLQQQKNNIRNHEQKYLRFKKTQISWKTVTTDLLRFNYQNSIIEIQQLVHKMSLSITQKCNKAISLLPSSQIFDKTNHYQMLTKQSKNWLKNTILSFVNINNNNNSEQFQYNQFIKKKQHQLKPQRNDSNFTLSQSKFN